MLRQSSLILSSAVCVVELYFELLELLHLGLEALVGHLLVKGSQLQICSSVSVWHLDLVS